MTARIQILGPMSIETSVGRLEEKDFEGRQERQILALLLSEHERSVTAEEIAEILWPGESVSRNWRKNIAAIVSKLRKKLRSIGLPELINTGKLGTYRANVPAGVWLDLDAAKDASANAQECLNRDDALAASSQAAVALAIARRPLLVGTEGRWLDEKRAELRDLRQDALDVVIEANLKLGKPSRAISAAEEMVTLDNLSEAAYQKLMIAHAAAGDRAQALRVYERCRTLLKNDLGTNPSPETERLYLTILRGEGVSSQSTPLQEIGPASKFLSTRRVYIETALELLKRTERSYRATVVGPIFLHPQWVVQRRDSRSQYRNYETEVKRLVVHLAKKTRNHDIRFILRNTSRYRAKVDEYVDIHERRKFVKDMLKAIDEVWGKSGDRGPDVCCVDTGYLAVELIFDHGVISSFRKSQMSPIEAGVLWAGTEIIERERARFDAVLDGSSQGQQIELAKLRKFVETLW